MGKKKIARRGEIWSINDKKTRGHKSLIVKGNVSNNKVSHLPFTHSPTTRNMRNIGLQQNPNPKDTTRSYILPKVQTSDERSLGKRNIDMKVKNNIDKSIIRNIKNIFNKKR